MQRLAAHRRAPLGASGPPAAPARQDIHPDDLAELRTFLRAGLRKALTGLPDSDVEDFTHDAIVRILQERASFRGDSRFSTWAMAVALRVAYGALRRRRYQERRVRVDSELVESTSTETAAPDDPHRSAERRDVVEMLRRAIDERLTERQRSAVLGELEEVPSDLLAERLGISRNAFYKLHHDARRKLRSALLEAGYTAQDILEELRSV
jgi:RNA polymerase sigma-70 factor (ECF subfamily)